MVLADMLNERVDGSVAIARGVLDLGADLAERLAFPCHFTRGEMPNRVARHAGGVEVGALMADWTAHGWKPMSIGATLDRRLVEPTHVTLTRTVAGGMTVQTARMRQHLA
jgi:hypothetical protein